MSDPNNLQNQLIEKQKHPITPIEDNEITNIFTNLNNKTIEMHRSVISYLLLYSQNYFFLNSSRESTLLSYYDEYNNLSSVEIILNNIRLNVDYIDYVIEKPNKKIWSILNQLTPEFIQMRTTFLINILFATHKTNKTTAKKIIQLNEKYVLSFLKNKSTLESEENIKNLEPNYFFFAIAAGK